MAAIEIEFVMQFSVAAQRESSWKKEKLKNNNIPQSWSIDEFAAWLAINKVDTLEKCK